ncbi:MAG: helix-turn-helix domain-containing protein, partial [Casimicrobiaceae bacterium]
MAVRTTKSAPNPQQTRRDRLSVATAHDAQRNPTLVALGARLRTLRARRGMTRKATAQVAEVSERYLANLEQGSGNPSMLILEQLAGALGCRVAELVGDVTTSSAEWLLIRELLRNKSEGDLRHAREAIGARFRTGSGHPKAARVALIGLRGAGKSTLGKMLADELDVPFVELSREVERIAGGDIR